MLLIGYLEITKLLGNSLTNQSKPDLVLIIVTMIKNKLMYEGGIVCDANRLTIVILIQL